MACFHILFQASIHKIINDNPGTECSIDSSSVNEQNTNNPPLGDVELINITEIKESCFSDSSIRTLIADESLKIIGRFAFSSSTQLEKVTIIGKTSFPGYHDEYGEYFSGCANLKSVELGSGFVRNMFSGCESLENVTIYADYQPFFPVFEGCRSLKNLYFPNVWGINLNLFTSQSSKIVRIECPKVTQISGNFDLSTKTIEYVDFRSLLNFHDRLFSGCSSLKTIIISHRITEIPVNCFTDCQHLNFQFKFISIRMINAFAFKNCNSLTKIEFQSVETIKDNAFENCANLENVKFTHSMKEIGSFCFNNCTKLSQIILPNSLDYLGEYSFSNCPIESVVFSHTLIDNNAFYNCQNLISITLYDCNVISGAFTGCNNINELRLYQYVCFQQLSFDESRTNQISITYYGLTDESTESTIEEIKRIHKNDINIKVLKTYSLDTYSGINVDKVIDTMNHDESSNISPQWQTMNIQMNEFLSKMRRLRMQR